MDSRHVFCSLVECFERYPVYAWERLYALLLRLLAGGIALVVLNNTFSVRKIIRVQYHSRLGSTNNSRTRQCYTKWYGCPVVLKRNHRDME